MKNSIESNISGIRYIISRASKIFLFSLSVVMLCVSILIHNQRQSQKVAETPQIVKNEKKLQENDMSAVRFATLPFILAFKHLFIDRKE